MQKILGSWWDLNPGPLALVYSAIPIELSRLDDKTKILIKYSSIN